MIFKSGLNKAWHRRERGDWMEEKGDSCKARRANPFVRLDLRGDKYEDGMGGIDSNLLLTV